MSRFSRQRRQENRQAAEQQRQADEQWQRDVDQLERARRWLAHCRQQFTDNNEEFKEQMTRAMEQLWGGDFNYRMTQINWQSRSDLPRLPRSRSGTAKLGDASDEICALLLAAVARCRHHCDHLPGPERSMFAILAARVCSCKQCMLGFTPLILASDERVKSKGQHSDECDFCLERGHGYFYQTSVAYMGFVYIGDACPACNQLFRGAHLPAGDKP